MKKVCIALIGWLLLAGSAVAYGQDIQGAFAPVFAQSAHGVKLGKYKGQELKGKYSGMGVISLKSGGVYYGDVAEGVPEGYGVMVCPDGIKGCPDAAVYSGRFKKGLMDGNGICYSAEGAPLYKGRFVGGELAQRSAAEGGGKFVVLDLTEGTRYIGEVQSSRPNGLGAIIAKGGDVVLGTFKNGQRDGIGVTIAANGEWQTENTTNGQTTVLSSSERYQALSQQNKATVSQMFSDISAAFSQAAADIAAIGKPDGAAAEPTAGADASDDKAGDDVDDEKVQKGKTYSKEYYQRHYEEYGKKVVSLLKDNARVIKMMDKKVLDGTYSASDANSLNSSWRYWIKSYNFNHDHMLRIYNEALKQGYNLKKFDFHGKKADAVFAHLRKTKR